MAELAKNPTGWQLEDFIAAHVVSRRCYVETGIKERNPDEILELDLVWTDYRPAREERHPVEVKSGEWGLGDLFRFYGWTRYLSMEPGQFVHRQPCGRVDESCLKHIATKTGIRLLHIPDTNQLEKHFAALGLPAPSWNELPEIWRYSFWAQRRLLRSLVEAIRQKKCVETAKAAKEYHRLINDAVFFISDVRDRISALFEAHFSHQHLARSAAYEIETKRVEFDAPPRSTTFDEALFKGRYFPVQACLYLDHRARLYLLKAIVDLWLARQRGELADKKLRIGQIVINLSGGGASQTMMEELEELSRAQSFRLFPIFWQTFLWSYGGFLLEDRLEDEYRNLSAETGVPLEEVPIALTAFDRLLPTPGGWFRKPKQDSRRLLMLMPAAIRGIGAVRRLTTYKLQNYGEFNYSDWTNANLLSDHNSGARLLDCTDVELTT